MTEADPAPDLLQRIRTVANARASSVALVDGGTHRTVTYEQLITSIDDGSDLHGLVFVLMHESIDHVLAYLAALEHSDAIALIHPAIPLDRFSTLVEAYAPDVVVGTEEDLRRLGLDCDPRTAGDDRIWLHRSAGGDDGSMHPELQLLLSTSGSTGSPKFVRLSTTNLGHNAVAIARSLALEPDDVAITCLPLHYTYGLSVLHSHLAVGSSIVCTSSDLLSKEFWSEFDRHGCTWLAGVPFSYSIYDRLRLLENLPLSLRGMTQAGGRLGPESVARYATALRDQGRGFYVMYGQTEATARMSVLPPELAPAHPDTVGYPLEDGTFEIVDSTDGRGEVVYRGPNVMMGYASNRNDLARGDELGGQLQTGDLGELTPEGLLRITGRVKRIVKVRGVRISLDEIEAIAQEHVQSAAVAGTDRVRVFVAMDVPDERALRRTIADSAGMVPRDVEIVRVEELPTTSRGKIDYRALEEIA